MCPALDPPTSSDPPVIDVQLVEGPVPMIAIDAWPAASGAESIFIGRTRGEDHPEHGALRLLRYEAHPTMALQELTAVVHRALEDTPAQHVVVRHAVGDVPVGAASVLVQVACGHRAESFVLCRRIIDDLKATVPIWKCEVWADGTSWADGTPVSPSDTSS